MELTDAMHQTDLLFGRRDGVHRVRKHVGKVSVLADRLVDGAIDAARPWGVDASSGLESSPGVKDPARIVAFTEEAKRA